MKHVVCWTGREWDINLPLETFCGLGVALDASVLP